MSNNETYEGWTNRETWALALWINNEQSWQESVHDALRGDDLPPHVAGEIIKEWAESLLTVDGYREETGEDHLPAGLSRVAEDIGSLYRVNWDELGASFLADIKSNES